MQLRAILLILIITLFWSIESKTQTVSTVTNAISYGRGIAVDVAGNLFVTERDVNDDIRKISPNTSVSLFSTGYTLISGITRINSGKFFIADCNKVIAVQANGIQSTYAAGFSCANGVAYDNNTDILYVADATGNRIYKVTANGVKTIFAGTGTAGNTNGQGTAASFNEPSGMAIDPAGNLYVAEVSNHQIRKITPAGVVTTFAGNGSAGLLNGVGTAAKFNQPIGLVFDPQGNLFVADKRNHVIRKIAMNGLVSIYAGSGTVGSIDGNAATARFNSPTGITMDNAEVIYVVENRDGGLVRKITKLTRPIRNMDQAQAAPLSSTINTQAFGSLEECNCGNWDSKKINYSDVTRDLTCNGSLTLIKNTTATFNLKYSCAPVNANCTTRYEVTITTPSGAISTVQITNNLNWPYTFSQLGNYTFTFKTYCNNVLCPDSCNYTITSK